MITCHQCHQPITSRETLAVVGRTLHPIHTGCRRAYAAAQPWYVSPGWAVNRWQSFVAFNAVLVGTLALFHVVVTPIPATELRTVVLLLAAANAWLLVARLVCWFSIERRIPG